MPLIDDQIKKKKPFKKKTYRSYLSLDDESEQILTPSHSSGLEINPFKVEPCVELPISGETSSKTEKISTNEPLATTPSPINEITPNGKKIDRKWVDNGKKIDRNWVDNEKKIDRNWVENGKKIDRFSTLLDDTIDYIEPSKSNLNDTIKDSKHEPEMGRKWEENRKKIDRKWEDEQVENGKKIDRRENEIDRKQVDKWVDEQVENGKKIDRKTTDPRLFRFIGLQRATLLYLYEKTKLSRDPRITDEIRVLDIAEAIQAPVNNTKNVLHELVKATAISRSESKKGRGGWTRFQIVDSIFEDLVLNESRRKQVENGQIIDRKQVDKWVDKWVDAPSSSSSTILESKNLLTTHPEPDRKEDSGLPEDWKQINCSPLHEIYFGQAQLNQIAQLGKLSPTDIQESIYAFAFDLKKNQKAKSLKSPPLNFFMGILRKGIPYAPPDNYESPEDEARRKYLEAKRAQIARRDAIERETLELEFEEWKNSLTPTNCRELAPHAKIDGSEMQLAALKQYFKESVYLNRLKEIPIEKNETIDEIRKQIRDSLST